MNRKILFRGKSIDNRFSGWVEGFYLEMELCDGDGRCSYIKMDGYSPIKVDPETVGQFTGLCDKHGLKVYEGDILKIAEYSNPFVYESDEFKKSFELDEFKIDKEDEYISSVVFEEGVFLIRRSERLADSISLLHGDQRFQCPIFDFEIIGNIYDTPSLLK